MFTNYINFNIMYLLVNVQSKDGAKPSAPQLVNTDKVCVSDLVGRELAKQDCVIIFQKIEECDKSDVEVNPFDKP